MPSLSGALTGPLSQGHSAAITAVSSGLPWTPANMPAAKANVWWDFSDTTKMTFATTDIVTVVPTLGRSITLTGPATFRPVMDGTIGVRFQTGKGFTVPNETQAYNRHRWFLAVGRFQNPQLMTAGSKRLLRINGGSTSATAQQPSLELDPSNGFLKWQTVASSTFVRSAGRSITTFSGSSVWFYILGWRTRLGDMLARVNERPESAGGLTDVYLQGDGTGTQGMIGNYTGLGDTSVANFDLTLRHLIIGQEWLDSTARDRLMGWANQQIIAAGGANQLDVAHPYYGAAPKITQTEISAQRFSPPTSGPTLEAYAWDYSQQYTALDLSGMTLARQIDADSLAKITDENAGQGPLMDRAIADTGVNAFVLKGNTPAMISTITDGFGTALRFSFQRTANLAKVISPSIQTINKNGSAGTSGILQRGGYFGVVGRKFKPPTTDGTNPVPEMRAAILWLKSKEFWENHTLPYTELDVNEAYAFEDPSAQHVTAWNHVADYPQAGEVTYNAKIQTVNKIRTRKIDGTQFNLSSPLTDGGWGISGNPGLFDGVYREYGVLLPPPGTKTGVVKFYLDRREVCRCPMIPEWDTEMYMICWIDHADVTDYNTANDGSRLLFAKQTLMDIKTFITYQWNGY